MSFQSSKPAEERPQGETREEKKATPAGFGRGRTAVSGVRKIRAREAGEINRGSSSRGSGASSIRGEAICRYNKNSVPSSGECCHERTTNRPWLISALRENSRNRKTSTVCRSNRLWPRERDTVDIYAGQWRVAG